MHWVWTLPLACVPIGCAAKQDYQLLPPATRDAMVRDSVIVIDGSVSKASRASGSLRQRILFFVPDLVPRNVHYELSIDVDSVVKVSESGNQIALTMRLPTDDERKLLLNEQGIIWSGTRFRVGYDHRRGSHLTKLRLVPIGNKPELAAMLEQARQMRDALSETCGSVSE